MKNKSLLGFVEYWPCTDLESELDKMVGADEILNIGMRSKFIFKASLLLKATCQRILIKF